MSPERVAFNMLVMDAGIDAERDLARQALADGAKAVVVANGG